MLCLPGHEGFLCSACVTGFYRDLPDTDIQCKKCGTSTVFLYIMIVGGLIIGISIIRQLLWSRNNGSAANRIDTARNDEIDTKVLKTSEGRIAAYRMVVSHLQVLRLCLGLNLTWSGAVTSVISVISGIAGLNVFDEVLGGGSDCLWRPRIISSPVFKILGYLWIIGCGLILTWFYWNYIHPMLLKNKGERGMKEDMNTNRIMSMTVFLYMMYPGFAEAFFAMFACDDIDGTLRLRNALDVQYSGSEYSAWLSFLGIPFGIIVVLGFPMICFLSVYSTTKAGAL